MNWDTDKQYQSHTVKSVEERPDGWEVSWREGMLLYVTNEHCKQAPVPGELARLYGRGLGYEVRGVVIGGRVYRYKTEAETEQARQDWLAAEQRKKLDALERERPERDAKIAALPEPLRQRIERFQRTLGGWRAEHEPSEIFVCEQAAAIAEALKTREAIRSFHGLPYEQQKELVPALDDGHSGNTFGAACRLAALLLDRPDLLDKEHGALCPLVGCADYGCFAAYEGKTASQ
jgi:hypothetical protein